MRALARLAIRTPFIRTVSERLIHAPIISLTAHYNKKSVYESWVDGMNYVDLEQSTQVNCISHDEEYRI